MTKSELEQRLFRIKENHHRPLDRESAERATEIENQEIVDALGNEAKFGLKLSMAALARIEAGE